jgi:Domain of unknown function (DUF892)
MTFRTLPKIAKAAEMPELTQAFMTHHEKTQGQIERLEADPSVIQCNEREKMNANVSGQDYTPGSSYYICGGRHNWTAKERLRVWLENDENLRSLDWLTHSAGRAPEIVVMMEVAPVKEGEDGEGV